MLLSTAAVLLVGVWGLVRRKGVLVRYDTSDSDVLSTQLLSTAAHMAHFGTWNRTAPLRCRRAHANVHVDFVLNPDMHDWVTRALPMYEAAKVRCDFALLSAGDDRPMPLGLVDEATVRRIVALPGLRGWWMTNAQRSCPPPVLGYPKCNAHLNATGWCCAVNHPKLHTLALGLPLNADESATRLVRGVSARHLLRPADWILWMRRSSENEALVFEAGGRTPTFDRTLAVWCDFTASKAQYGGPNQATRRRLGVVNTIRGILYCSKIPIIRVF